MKVENVFAEQATRQFKQMLYPSEVPNLFILFFVLTWSQIKFIEIKKKEDKRQGWRKVKKFLGPEAKVLDKPPLY